MRRGGAVVGLVALAVAGQAHVGAGTYALRRGDSLSQVAGRFGVSVRALAGANRIADPDRVRAGRVLTLPGSKARARAGAAPLPSRRVVATGARLHRVQPGQTLASVAARYRTSVSTLARANAIADPDRLTAGRLLRIPGPPWLCPVRGARGPRDFGDGWGDPRPGGRRHVGVDVFAARGTPVVASVSGVVEHSRGALAGLGYYLRGDDGNTYYGSHLDKLVAPAGRVERGAVIGTVGTTGNAHGTPPHLHFELKPGGGASVNPFPTLSRWC